MAHVDQLALVKPLADKIDALKSELPNYVAAAATVTIDYTETGEDHSFTKGVLKFFKEKGSNFPAWTACAQIVFTFTPNSAAAERVFSLLKSMFAEDQLSALADYIQAAVMLRYNKREVG